MTNVAENTSAIEREGFPSATPNGLLRWQSILFMIGGSGFAAASVPYISSVAAPTLLAWVYVISACFFTSAGFCQVVGAANEQRLARATSAVRLRLFTPEAVTVAWVAAAIQSLGTLFFNVTTIRSLLEDWGKIDNAYIVWRPNALGSLCFLISSVLAFWVLTGAGVQVRRLGMKSVDLRSTWWNMVGSILFGVSAVAAFISPSTNEPLNAALMNSTTMLGALCFVRAAQIVKPAAADES